jgi:AmmeMemoRadiSam system protein B
LIRKAAVAGSFYPEDPGNLQRTVHNFLDGAKKNLPVPKAVIAPHAGYIYSGPIVANAYAALASVSATIKRVILLGASHYANFEVIALSGAKSFATPLGLLKIDQVAAKQILSFSDVAILDEAHVAEHSLEVQLPFLQVLLKDFVIVPLLVNSITPQQIAKVIEALWGGPETLIVISSDLSHYLDYKMAKKTDQKTAQAIVNLSPQDIQEYQACGSLPIKGMLEVAIKKHLQAAVIDLRNSGDTSGGRDRVVGYGAFHFYERQKI